MKKIICLILCAFIALTAFAGCGGTENRDNVLKIYNWAAYIDETVIEDFETYYRTKTGNEDFEVIYSTFDTNETMYTKIAKGKEDYDLICPSDYMIEKMLSENLCKPLDMDVITNYDNIPSYIRDEYESINGVYYSEDTIFSVGYFWGTLGILYNANEITEAELEEKGWAILWDEEYKNQIYMKDSVRDSYAVGVLYAFEKEFKKAQKDYESGEMTLTAYQNRLNELFNDTSAETVAKVEKVLKEQREVVNAMYDVDNDKNALINGTALLDVSWSGDAAWAIEQAKEANNGIELAYYIPSYGSNVWFDGWCIPAYAENEEAANEFINYLLQPEIAIRNMEAVGYTSVVGSAKSNNKIYNWVNENAPEDAALTNVSYFFEGMIEMKVNAVQYPDINLINACSVMADFGSANDRVMEMWTRVRGNELSNGVIIAIAAVVAVVVVGAIVYLALKPAKAVKTTAKKTREYTPEDDE